MDVTFSKCDQDGNMITDGIDSLSVAYGASSIVRNVIAISQRLIIYVGYGLVLVIRIW